MPRPRAEKAFSKGSALTTFPNTLQGDGQLLAHKENVQKPSRESAQAASTARAEQHRVFSMGWRLGRAGTARRSPWTWRSHGTVPRNCLMSQEVPLFGSLHGLRISQPFSSAYPAAGGEGGSAGPLPNIVQTAENLLKIINNHNHPTSRNTVLEEGRKHEAVTTNYFLFSQTPHKLTSTRHDALASHSPAGSRTPHLGGFLFLQTPPESRGELPSFHFLKGFPLSLLFFPHSFKIQL